MTREDVEDVILRPMQALFSPGGQHFRGKPEVLALALEEYVKALARFDRSALEQAWEHVRDHHQFMIWPPPQSFVAAAELAQSHSQAQKHQRAAALVDTKVCGYRKNSKLYRQAQREGWAGHLMDFVRRQLSIQAQLLEGCTGISFDAHLLGANTSASSSGEALQQIRDWLGSRFLDEGKLIVKPPPKELVQSWRERMKDNGTPNPLEETLQRLQEQRNRQRGR